MQLSHKPKQKFYIRSGYCIPNINIIHQTTLSYNPTVYNGKKQNNFIIYHSINQEIKSRSIFHMESRCETDQFPRYMSPCWLCPIFTIMRITVAISASSSENLISTSIYGQIIVYNFICQTVLKIHCLQYFKIASYIQIKKNNYRSI